MEQVKSGYGALTLAAATQTLYGEGQTDYSFEPLVLTDETGQPVGPVRDGDAVIFCCRRGEREIQLTEAFTEREFSHFSREYLENLTFVILTLYHEKFKDLPVAFAPSKISPTLAEIVSRAGLRQLHVAESEKFAHITFFFNGGNNQPYENEQDVRIPSPKGVPFDQVPELSLPQVADRVIQGLEEGIEFIAANFANGDVIGHTSNRPAKIRCAELVDTHLGRVMDASCRAGYVTLITADHGNLEVMTNPDGSDHVSHTGNPVAFILVDPRQSQPSLVKDGWLADVAPTILRAMGINAPEAMQGKDLAPSCDWGGPRKVLLIILDGWGIGEQNEGNPIFLANTPVWDELLRDYPNSRLAASGEEVGLQSGKAGNSEAGHLNLGAGRVIPQDDVRLDQALKDGSFAQNEVFTRVMEDVCQRGSSLHLIGLLTEKSSHGSIDYPLALIKMARQAGLEKVFLHIIFDGRSTAPGSAPTLLAKLEAQLAEIGLGQVATGTGRGIALDRDGNYEKTRRTYAAMTLGQGRLFPAREGEQP